MPFQGNLSCNVVSDVALIQTETPLEVLGFLWYLDWSPLQIFQFHSYKTDSIAGQRKDKSLTLIPNSPIRVKKPAVCSSAVVYCCHLTPFKASKISNTTNNRLNEETKQPSNCRHVCYNVEKCDKGLTIVCQTLTNCFTKSAESQKCWHGIVPKQVKNTASRKYK